MKRIVALCLVLASGCATAQMSAQAVHPGMPREQVLAKMGKPDGYQLENGIETLTYSDQLVSGWSWDRTDFMVQLRDGKVIGYGIGQVRPHNPNVVVVAPLRPLP